MGGYCAVLQKYLPWHLTLIHLNSACMSMPLYFVDCIVDTITHDSMSWLYFLNSGAGHISRSWCVVTGGLVPSAHSWSQGVQIPHEKYSSCAESWISRRLVLTDSQLASHVSQDKVQRDHKSELLGNPGTTSQEWCNGSIRLPTYFTYYFWMFGWAYSRLESVRLINLLCVEVNNQYYSFLGSASLCLSINYTYTIT